MYIQVPLVDHLRPLHKTSDSEIIALGILKNSTTGSFVRDSLYTISCINTLDYFQHMGFSITPLLEFQQTHRDIHAGGGGYSNVYRVGV